MTTNSLQSKGRGKSALAIAKLTPDEMRKGASPAEQLQTIAHQVPEDAAATLRENWPDLWSQIVGAGRSHGLRPVPMMVALIKRGLGDD